MGKTHALRYYDRMKAQEKIQKTINELETRANLQESEGITRPERLAVIGQIYEERAKLARLSTN